MAIKYNLIDRNFRMLFLADGTRADLQRRGALAQALTALGLLGITAEMPKDEMLFAYQAEVLRVVNELYPSRGTGITAALLDRPRSLEAARVIAERAGNPKPGSLAARSPHRAAGSIGYLTAREGAA